MDTDNNSERNIQNKIAELDAIYGNFVSKLNELKSERNVVINAIIKRVDEQKIKKIMQDLHKKN